MTAETTLPADVLMAQFETALRDYHEGNVSRDVVDDARSALDARLLEMVSERETGRLSSCSDCGGTRIPLTTRVCLCRSQLDAARSPEAARHE